MGAHLSREDIEDLGLSINKDALRVMFSTLVIIVSGYLYLMS